jgi:hypothetical protein
MKSPAGLCFERDRLRRVGEDRERRYALRGPGEPRGEAIGKRHVLSVIGAMGMLIELNEDLSRCQGEDLSMHARMRVRVRGE